jgi:hypothetical protein
MWAYGKKVANMERRYENEKTGKRENAIKRMEDMWIRGYAVTITGRQTVTLNPLPLHSIVGVGIGIGIGIEKTHLLPISRADSGIL